jgi:hypothetical protein
MLKPLFSFFLFLCIFNVHAVSTQQHFFSWARFSEDEKFVYVHWEKDAKEEITIFSSKNNHSINEFNKMLYPADGLYETSTKRRLYTLDDSFHKFANILIFNSGKYIVELNETILIFKEGHLYKTFNYSNYCTGLRFFPSNPPFSKRFSIQSYEVNQEKNEITIKACNHFFKIDAESGRIDTSLDYINVYGRSVVITIFSLLLLFLSFKKILKKNKKAKLVSKD